ncbi:PspA/IM30 family protein [bacterium]|nr:PspA/IM30 family protein [bacterium]
MGIWSRISRVFKSNVNAAIDKMEDPQKVLNQTIMDMQDQLVKAKQQVAVAIADEKRLEKQYLAEEGKAKEWTEKAKLALKAGNEELAKKALIEKQTYDNNSQGYKTEWMKQKAMTDKLRNSLKDLSDKIEDAKRKKNLLVARAKRAEAQKSIQETMSGMSENSAFETFDRMAEKVDQLEAEADATDELAADFQGSSADLDKEFKALQAGGAGADDELEKMKREMGLLSGGSSDTPKLDAPK